MHLSFSACTSQVTVHQAVADPGFSPRGGCANSQNYYYFSNFCRKLHENERFWTPGGDVRPLRPPWIRQCQDQLESNQLPYFETLPVADLHSKILNTRPPWGSKFFQFHAVFGKIGQNRMLVRPLPRRVGAPSSGKSWISH